MGSPAVWRASIVVLIAALQADVAHARPFVPDNDAVVLERLPEKGDAALTHLKRMRAALIANPRDLDIALPVARSAIDAARTFGDPRFLGHAQAALAPWWTGYDIPVAVLLLRATLKQSQHDFDGALADLDHLLAAQPSLAQGRLTRATVHSVIGRYADARRDCATLVGRVAAIVVAACDAAPASLSGHGAAAYETLRQTLADAGGNAEVRAWASTLAAEIAARRGDPATAERHFRTALAIDPRDPYLKGAYADFLLDHERPRDVLALLRDDERNDALLLRLALAEQGLADHAASFAKHREALAARFDAARRRGDAVHRREEARFRLAIEHDARAALALARDNWAVQREPADLRILIEAAQSTGDAATLKIVADWIIAHHLDDAILVPRAERAR